MGNAEIKGRDEEMNYSELNLESGKISFDCGAHQDVATSQDLDAPPEKNRENMYRYLAATSQDLETHF